jgi:hypothetical protein
MVFLLLLHYRLMELLVDRAAVCNFQRSKEGTTVASTQDIRSSRLIYQNAPVDLMRSNWPNRATFPILPADFLFGNCFLAECARKHSMHIAFCPVARRRGARCAAC